MTTGLGLTVAGEADFHLSGFVLVQLASVMSGLRWTLTQKVMASAKLGLSHPVLTIRSLALPMASTVFAVSVVVERPWETLGDSPYFASPVALLATFGLVFASACIAFTMTLTEFALLHSTSALTVMVTGICKEVTTIVVSVIIFGDRLSAENISGLLLILGGVAAYTHARTTAAGAPSAALELTRASTDGNRACSSSSSSSTTTTTTSFSEDVTLLVAAAADEDYRR
mmetsp:Transcript_27631/g.90391  ORF Transcript_27631/g.90391 Transcript_27631/m.90391 type:complete len:228 (-) Transcript_27631:20-703(-)